MPGADAFDLFRPYLWLALCAFLAGFVSYVALGGVRSAQRARIEPVPRVSAPVSTTDVWNLPKHI